MPPLALTVFFFSSRRRHTRLQGDWSSDVCSSDLNTDLSPAAHDPLRSRQPAQEQMPVTLGDYSAVQQHHDTGVLPAANQPRSEERRVGKEWRTRGSPTPIKKTDATGGGDREKQNT